MAISVQQLAPRDVFILAAVRTPIGGYNGSLASLSAVQLGTLAVQEVMKRTPLEGSDVDEVYFGNVVSAGNGQNIARQVAVHAGLPKTVPATTVNKVCASGLKAIALGALAIRSGEADTIVAGGTESMSQAPHLFPKARFGVKYGNAELVDALVRDGLTDAMEQFGMGLAAEATVKASGMTRQAQDDHAIASYTRAQTAERQGWWGAERVPISVPGAKGKPPTIVNTDDEIPNMNPDKLRTLRPSFDPQGSVTAANSSPLSDGAAAVVLVSGAKLAQLVSSGRWGGSPSSSSSSTTDSSSSKNNNSNRTVFRLLACADAEQEPMKFTTTPAVAIPKALHKCGLTVQDVAYFELNEAFSCVAVANTQLLNLNPDRVNVFGGAVALGATLMNVLNHHEEKIGCAGICNGGGGASACVIERIQLS